MVEELASENDGDDLSSIADQSSPKQGNRLSCSRVVIEVGPVSEMLTRHLSCLKCQNPLAISFPTTGIASSCKLVCTDEVKCDYVSLCAPAGADIPLDDNAGSAKMTRSVDFALNITCVLSFIACRDGGTEAERVLGLNGLPNSTAMQSAFSKIEQRISGPIQECTDEIVLNNLREEVKLTFADQTDDNNNLLCDLWLQKKLSQDQWPRIGGSTDMGWQQKGSGRLRNSKSGHALFIGPLTRKVVAKSLCSKACGKCKKWYMSHPTTEQPPQHNCFINHAGKSGAMEPIAVLAMYKCIYNQEVTLEWMACDDNSSIKAKLKWSNEDHMKNNNATEIPKVVNSNVNLVDRPNYGGIPGHVPELTFKADPNHGRKILTNELCDLALKNKTTPEEREKKIQKKQQRLIEEAKQKGKPAPNFKDDKKDYEWNLTMTKMDVRQLSKNFGYMIRTLKNKNTDEEMLNSAAAVLEHHFDNHKFCGSFCRRKAKQESGKLDEGKHCREKGKDDLLCERLQSMLKRFITLDASKEVTHSLDTCANESFNDTVAWVAPKNKVYAGSNSLCNRMSVAIVQCPNLPTIGYA